MHDEVTSLWIHVWWILGHEVHTCGTDWHSVFEVLSIKKQGSHFLFLWYSLFSRCCMNTLLIIMCLLPELYQKQLKSLKDNTTMIQTQGRFWAFFQLLEEYLRLFPSLSEPSFLPHRIERYQGHFELFLGLTATPFLEAILNLSIQTHIFYKQK